MGYERDKGCLKSELWHSEMMWNTKGGMQKIELRVRVIFKDEQEERD